MNWSRNRHPAHAARTYQRGATTLLISLILLTVITMASFVAYRSLLADQTMAGNHYRTMRARMAAEAGLDFTLSQLQRSEGRAVLMSYNENGYRILPDTLYRPADDDLGQVASTAGFSSSLVMLDDATPPGDTLPTLSISARGCWTPADNQDASCTTCSSDCVNTAIASSMVRFVSALPAPPLAALTSRGDIDLSASSLTLANSASGTGYTVHAGGTVLIDGSTELIGIPGTPVEASLITEDDSLRDGSDEDYFERFFGLPQAVHRDHVDLRIDCQAGCSDMLHGITDRAVWLEAEGSAPIRLESVQLGSDDEPVILIADHPLELRGNTQITGLVFAPALDWDATGSSTHVTGAVIVVDDLQTNGDPRIDYDPAVLRTLALRLGSVVRVPGSWRDF